VIRTAQCTATVLNFNALFSNFYVFVCAWSDFVTENIGKICSFYVSTFNTVEVISLRYGIWKLDDTLLQCPLEFCFCYLLQNIELPSSNFNVYI